MELTINLPDGTDRVGILGTADRNVKLLREALGVTITARGDVVRLSGDGPAVNRAAEVIAQLTDAAKRRRPMGTSELIGHLHRLDGELARQPGTQRTDYIDTYIPQARIAPKTAGQRRYLESIHDHDMVFCTGPAGTGKTYLAVAAAVSLLKHGATRKLVLARPAVEAGERLGFLPGDMQQKVNPYLRPLLDSLNDMMPFEQVQRFMDGDIIEVVPLAFMRGRTLNDAIIILDEAQNTTRMQMLMFLTRLGRGGKMIITGDTSQIDLPSGEGCGLIDAARRLKRIPGIDFVTLDRADIVRHSLVTRIVEAYGDPSDKT